MSADLIRRYPGACQPELEPVPTGDRCTGNCCRQFSLPWTHTELASWLRNEALPDGMRSLDDETGGEVSMIVAMTRPAPNGDEHAYTCILFDGSGCTAYEARPEMCSAYPYGKRCEHGKRCSWTEGRRGAHGRPEKMRLRLPVVS